MNVMAARAHMILHGFKIYRWRGLESSSGLRIKRGACDMELMLQPRAEGWAWGRSIKLDNYTETEWSFVPVQDWPELLALLEKENAP